MLHRLSGSAASGILPDQGSNLCRNLLHCQADSLPPSPEGSPEYDYEKELNILRSIKE